MATDKMVQQVRQAVIMVGGKGTRLLPLTENRPKPILPVLNKPCLRYLVESLAEAGVVEVILACGYRSEKLSNAIGDGSDLGIKIEYSYEKEPLGTGGAIKLVEDRLDDVFVAANGDVFADIDVREEIDAHFSSGAKITMALTSVKNPCEFGIARLDDSGRITEYKEKPKPEEAFSNLVNAGVYVIDKSVMSEVPEGEFFDFSKDLFPMVMSKGDKIQGYVLKGVWRDVGRPSDLLGVNLAMATELYDDFSWGGKRTESTTVVRPFYLGNESFVVRSDITAAVVLDDCTVNDSRVVKSLIMNGCNVTSAKIESSIIGEGCIIKPGARITNAVLADGTVVEEGKEITDSQVFK
ncbi:MAG: NDP-sugar synthase [Candidatus Methanoplasma sp.]|jgi:mannose-1-phosphate guanylyltransferase|nr:NDP-sugar synthase [Candidatus Methanoplasma sp.]